MFFVFGVANVSNIWHLGTFATPTVDALTKIKYKKLKEPMIYLFIYLLLLLLLLFWHERHLDLGFVWFDGRGRKRKERNDFPLFV